MAAPYRPDSVKQFQAENWYWVPSGGIADQANPTIAELGAAGVIEMTGYLFTDITRPTRNTNLVTRERRLADPAQFQQVGTGTWTGGTINHALDPQSAPGDPERALFDEWVNGAEGFFVQRAGVDVDTALAATTQHVSVYPVDIDECALIPEGSDDAAETAATNTYTVTGPPSLLVPIHA